MVQNIDKRIKDRESKNTNLHSAFNAPHSRKGFTLLYSVLVSSLLLSLGLAIFNIIIKELIISSTIRDSQIAFAAADSAAECALFWDLQYPGLENGAFGGPNLGILNQGLTAHWTLDDGSGDTASDASGSGNDGTLVNMDSGSWTSGYVAGALNFDGLDDYISIDGNAGIDRSGNMSVSFWARNDDLSTQMVAFGASPDGIINIYPHRAGTIQLSLGWKAWTFDDTAVPSAGVGEWAHYVVVVGSSNLTMYLNGSPIWTELRTKNANNNPTSFGIGHRNNTNTLFYNGSIDDVRLYSRALDQEDVSALYNLSPVQVFEPPVDSGSGINCGGSDVSATWDASETDVDIEYAKTVFNMSFPNDTCSTVTVIKEESDTRIDSRGYNTCDINNPRRVERGLRVTY